MKLKKYNLSLSSLYEDSDIHEGYGRLRTKARYEDPTAERCQIDMTQFQNVREFIFSVGQYAPKGEDGKPVGHKKAMKVLADTIPVSIFSSVEAALADETVFNKLFARDGIVIDLATLGMTSMECRLFQFGMRQLSDLLSTFANFKKGAKQRDAQKNADLADAQAKAAAAGLATYPEIVKINQEIFVLHAEDNERIDNIKRELRIEEFSFREKFRKFSDPSHGGDLNANILHFQNFFGTYYQTGKWDEDKLQEDVDFVINLAKRIKSNSPDKPLVDIYKTLINEINIRPNQENLKILEDLEAQAQAAKGGSEQFEKRFLGMLFNPKINKNNSTFYGVIIYILSENRMLQQEFNGSIKSKIQLLKRDLSSIIS